VVEVGATGSFISPDGLIITNHHVAFGSVVAASTPEKDYLKNGFLAKTRAEEIPASGRTARITESFKDVSAEVLRVVRKNMSNAERTKAIEQQIKKIVAREEKANPGKRAEVAEMFPGKTYWLFCTQSSEISGWSMCRHWRLAILAGKRTTGCGPATRAILP